MQGVNLVCLGSSSKGNCYLLKAADGTLIIECGISVQRIKQALNWRVDSVVGCIVTHEHNDHAKHLTDILKCGIKVLALPEVFRSHPSPLKSLCKTIKPMQGYRLGGFKIIPVAVAHDVACVGYLIEHQEMGRLLFVTDTMMLEYRFPGLNHIMLEANYSDEILQRNIKEGVVLPSMAQRLLQSHMELKTAVGIIKANDLTHVSEVILLHLSERNSDAVTFIEEIEKAAARPVYAAHDNFAMTLSNEPY